MLITIILAVFLICAGVLGVYGSFYVISAGILALLAALGLKKD